MHSMEVSLLFTRVTSTLDPQYCVQPLRPKAARSSLSSSLKPSGTALTVAPAAFVLHTPFSLLSTPAVLQPPG